MLTTAVSFTIRIFNEPTPFNFVSVLMFSFMGFFFTGLALPSIRTFSTDGQILTENILGLIKTHTDLKEIQCYCIKQASNVFGTFDQLILNKRDGYTIFIESYDQNGFKELRLELESQLILDSKAKPNYWTKFIRASAIWLCIWIGLMIIFMLAEKFMVSV